MSIFNKTSFFSLAFAIAVIIAITIYFKHKNPCNLPIVAVANYGPHSSLDATIVGLKTELTKQGFVEGKNIKYDIEDVGFDAALIPQMIAKLKSQQPKVMVAMTTPIAQFAKGSIKDIPLVYSVITDPLEAGLIKETLKADQNMTGSSDRQDLTILLEFAKKQIPGATRVGLLYATAESNDKALVRMMQQAAKTTNMEVVAIPIDQARDVPVRMQQFKGKIDFIYVGTSGPIQPTLPVIAAESKKMAIPVLNADEGAVKDGLVLASFGVDYQQIGANTGKLVAQILNGSEVSELPPVYPKSTDHHGFINKTKAAELGLSIPTQNDNLEIVE